MTTKQIIKFYESQLEIPNRKIQYLLNNNPELILGAFKSIEKYGTTISTDIFNIFFDVISNKLANNEDVEYEFSEIQYNNLMNLKTYIK